MVSQPRRARPSSKEKGKEESLPPEQISSQVAERGESGPGIVSEDPPARQRWAWHQ